jgi:hypothetical protein
MPIVADYDATDKRFARQIPAESMPVFSQTAPKGRLPRQTAPRCPIDISRVPIASYCATLLAQYDPQNQHR